MFSNFMLLLISILLGVLGQTVIKYGVNQIGDIASLGAVKFIISSFTNIFVLGGLFIYFISSIFWIIVLSKLNLSIAYPALSLGYILILVISVFFFHETVNFLQILGIFLIMAGVVCIFRG